MMQVDIPATLRLILDESSLPDAEKNHVLARLRSLLGIPKTLDDVLEGILSAARLNSQFSAETAREMLEPVWPVKIEYVPAPLVNAPFGWSPCGPTCAAGGQGQLRHGEPPHFVGTVAGVERQAPF